MGLCKSLVNLGASVCDNPISVASRLIFVPLVGASGQANGFDTDEAVTKAGVETMINAANRQDRIYPLPILEDVESKRGDAAFHEFKSGAKKFVKYGTKHLSAFIPMQHAQFLEKLKAWNGQKFGVFIVDLKGNFIYQTDAATREKVLPFPVDGNSFVADYVDPTYSEVNMVKMDFDYKVSAKDEMMRFIPASALDFNALDEDEVYALWDVKAEVSNESTAGFDLKLVTDYGVPVTSLEQTDFSITDQEGDAATITGVTIAEDGTYTIACDSLIGGEILKVVATQNRYDFSALAALTVTIP